MNLGFADPERRIDREQLKETTKKGRKSLGIRSPKRPGAGSKNDSQASWIQRAPDFDFEPNVVGIAVRHVRDSVADGRQESQGRNPAVGGDTPRLSARFGLSHKYPLRGKLAAGQGIHGSTHSRLPSIPKYAHSFTLGRRALSMETSCGEGLETFDALCGSSFYFDGLAPAWIRRHTLCSYEDRHHSPSPTGRNHEAPKEKWHW